MRHDSRIEEWGQNRVREQVQVRQGCSRPLFHVGKRLVCSEKGGGLEVNANADPCSLVNRAPGCCMFAAKKKLNARSLLVACAQRLDHQTVTSSTCTCSWEIVDAACRIRDVH